MISRPRKRDHMRSFFDTMVNRIRRFRTTKKQAGTTLWESWDLDPAFFKALSQWTRDNDNITLEVFLRDTIKAIDLGKEFLEGVPDGPIPIRGFLKALAHLVKLGAMVGRAQREVYDFATYVVHWVGSIKSAFESNDLGPTARQLQKRYLKEMRCLIDEICRWAVARLEDKRWSIQGMMVEKEIDDFKARIAAARALFLDVATIITAKSQDMQLTTIQSLISTIQDIQLSQTNFLEFLEEQRKEAERRRFLDDIFLHHSADKTAYDEQGKRPCDRDTRVEILRDIKAWIWDIEETAPRFLWLTGDPGAGKSAITASITQECQDSDILWAQFFINRNLAGTTNPALYFPSIARQLADRSPMVSLAIYNTLKAKRSIINDLSQEQAGKLFVDSLKVASSTEPTKPIMVIIDGLDETDACRLQTTAEIFSRAVLDLPSNVKIFISSRTEDEIRKPFHSTFSKTPEKVKHIHLDTTSKSSIEDVSRFLRKGIIAIAHQNDLDVLTWPGKERLDTLCIRAAGLFIWAVTVIGFIETEVKESGKEILDSILNSFTASDLTDINTLYGTILRMMFRGRKDQWKADRFRRIVGCLVVLREPLCIHDITLLLNLRNPDSHKPADILNFFTRLRTILVSGVEVITPQTVPRLHKSFFEFITDDKADQYIDTTSSPPLMHPINVNIKAADENIAYRCLIYIAKSYTPRNGAMQVSGLMSEISRGQSEFSSSLLRYAHAHAQSHWGGRSGILAQNMLQIQDIGNISEPQIPRPKNSQALNINCVTAPPVGRHLAYGSDYSTIHLWDIGTGKHIGLPMEGHSSRIWSVAFSPDGKLIASASHDHALRLWSVESGQQVAGPLTYHTGNINCVVFSVDGTRIVSGSDDKTVHIWNLDGTKDMCLEGHINIVRAVACSPHTLGGKEYIISGSHDMTIGLWECSGDNANYSKSFTGHTDVVVSVAFEPAASSRDSLQFVSGSLDMSVRLWNIDLESCIRVFYGHTSSVWSVVFSSCSQYIISGSLDKTVRTWDLKTGDSISRAIHTDPIRGATCRGRLIATSSDSGIQLWTQKEQFTATPSLIPLYNPNNDVLVSISISPDYESIATAFSNGNILVWRESTGTYIPLGPGTSERITFKGRGRAALTFSPDGNIIAALYPGNHVCIWDIETEKTLSSYVLSQCAAESPTYISFSSDGRHLLTFKTNGSCQAWDSRSGAPVSATTDVDTSVTGRGDASETFLFGYGSHLIWYPLDEPEFGFCVVTDKRLIRMDNNGVVTLIPLTPLPQTENVGTGFEYTVPEEQDSKLKVMLSSSVANSVNSDAEQTNKLVERDVLLDEHIFIAVIAPTGSGKYSFVEEVIRRKPNARHAIRAHGTDIRVVTVESRMRSDYRISFIDILGLGSDEQSEAEIWETLDKKLIKIYECSVPLSGILYFPVDNPAILLKPFEDMSVIKEFFGESASQKVILVDTVPDWGRAVENLGKPLGWHFRTQLMALPDQDFNITQWTGTAESAWGVIHRFVETGNNHYVDRLRKEMAHMKKQLCETNAGQDLYRALGRLVSTQRAILHEFRTSEHRDGDEASVTAKYVQNYRQLAAILDEIQALRFSVRPQLLSMLFSVNLGEGG